MAESKASLKRRMKELGLPIPKDASVTDLKHRLETWKSGHGYLVRLALPPTRRPDTPVSLLELGVLYWLPNSVFAEMVVNSKLAYIVDRCESCPKGATFFDVPKDFNDKWGIGVDNGSDDISNS